MIADSPRRREDNLSSGSLHDFTETKYFTGINEGEFAATFESPLAGPSIQYAVTNLHQEKLS
jgi:hypothetical protein